MLPLCHTVQHKTKAQHRNVTDIIVNIKVTVQHRFVRVLKFNIKFNTDLLQPYCKVQNKAKTQLRNVTYTVIKFNIMSLINTDFSQS